MKQKFLKNNPGKDIKQFTFEDIEIEYEKPIDEQDPFEFYPEEDKIYALGMFKYTYGYWDLLKNEIRNCPHFLFNWVVQTRTTAEIQKRCDFLITQFKKELYVNGEGPQLKKSVTEGEPDPKKKKNTRAQRKRTRRSKESGEDEIS